MKTVLIVVLVIVLVAVVGAGAFYEGSNYGFAQAQNIRTEFFQSRGGQGGALSGGTPSAQGTRGAGQGAQGGQGAQFVGRGVNGTVKSVDGNTMVVTQRDGSTVTVTINAQTAIQKVSTGTTGDLVPGANVTVTSSETGSTVTAQTIQIRPTGQ